MRRTVFSWWLFVISSLGKVCRINQKKSTSLWKEILLRLYTYFVCETGTEVHLHVAHGYAIMWSFWSGHGCDNGGQIECDNLKTLILIRLLMIFSCVFLLWCLVVIKRNESVLKNNKINKLYVSELESEADSRYVRSSVQCQEFVSMTEF